VKHWWVVAVYHPIGLFFPDARDTVYHAARPVLADSSGNFPPFLLDVNSLILMDYAGPSAQPSSRIVIFDSCPTISRPKDKYTNAAINLLRDIGNREGRVFHNVLPPIVNGKVRKGYVQMRVDIDIHYGRYQFKPIHMIVAYMLWRSFSTLPKDAISCTQYKTYVFAGISS